MKYPVLPDCDLLSQVKNYGAPVSPASFRGNRSAKQESLADRFRMSLRVQDLQEFIGRYKWYNLPEGIDQELLERMFYYRGQVGIFYEPAEEKLYILPYVLNGSIDMYGRYTGVSFLPFNGKAETENGKKNIYIPGELREPQYEILLPEELTLEKFNNACVLCTDYSKQLAQKIKPRAELQECVIQLESELYPFVRTALLSNTGIRLLKVRSEAEAEQIPILNQTMYDAALNGDCNLSYIGDVTADTLDSPVAAKPDDYLLTLQSLDNMRLNMMGLQNGGIFQKKAHMLEDENAMIESNSSSVYMDGLRNRQRWCNIINSIWGIGMWCEPSETEMEMDMNGDGLVTNGDEDSAESQITEGDDSNAELSE